MVLLRQFTSSDATSIVTYLNDPLVTRYITDAIPKPYTIADATGWVAHSQTSNTIMAIEYNGLFVGCISAQIGEFEYSRSAQLGYWIGKEFWNKGIATQAVTLFCQQLTRDTDMMRLYVSVVVDNGASSRVLAKNGFVCEGVHRAASYKAGVFYDESVWAKMVNEA